jgi:hypothetical protein
LVLDGANGCPPKKTGGLYKTCHRQRKVVL